MLKLYRDTLNLFLQQFTASSSVMANKFYSRAAWSPIVHVAIPFQSAERLKMDLYIALGELTNLIV